MSNPDKGPPSNGKKKAFTQSDFEAAISRLVQTSNAPVTSIDYGNQCDPCPEVKPRCGDTCSCGCREEPVNLATGDAEPDLSFEELTINPSGGSGPRRRMLTEPFLTQLQKPDGSPWRAFIEMTPGVMGGHVYHYNIPDQHYAPCHGCKATLTCIPVEDGVDAGTDTSLWDYDLKEPDGTTYRFNDAGYLVYRIDPNGDKTTWHRVANSTDNRVDQIRREFNRDGQDYEEVQDVQYVSIAGAFRPSSILRQRRMIAIGSAMQPISKVQITYYMDGKIEQIGEQLHEYGAWGQWNNTYFRFHVGNEDGESDQIKMIVRPDDYRRTGGNASAMDDTTLGSYASVNFWYDSDRRVKRVRTINGTKYITYTVNEDPGATADPHNNWAIKAEMTSADGLNLTVFGNMMGRDVVKHESAGAINRMTWYQFDGEGRRIAEYTPTSIDFNSGLPYDELENALAVRVKPNDGMVRKTVYYQGGGSDGQADCYPHQELIQQGSEGTPCVAREFTYERRAVMVEGIEGEVVVYLPKETRRFRKEEATGLIHPVVDRVDYEFYPGKLQIKSRTSRRPEIKAIHNGDIALEPLEVTEEFDAWGRRVKTFGTGMVTTIYEYEPLTGAMIRKVEQVGSEAHETVTTVDEHGRVIEEIGPEHLVDGQPNRHVNWTIYKNPQERWTARGYMDENGNKTLVNPVQIVRREEKVVHSIAAARGNGPESPGALEITDTFPPTSWTSWSCDHENNSGQVTESRVYHDIQSNGYTATQFVYNGRGLVGMTIRPDGVVTGTNYDGLKLPVAETMGPAIENRYTMSTSSYDSVGRLDETVQYQDVDGSNARRTLNEYNWQDQLVRTTQIGPEDNIVQKNEYDSLGRVVATEMLSQASDGVETLFARTETGYNDVDQIYKTTQFGVDQETGVLTGETIVHQNIYDAQGRLQKRIMPGGTEFMEYVYDELGRQTSQSNAMGHTQATSYNEVGQVITRTDALQNATTYEYDRAGRMFRTINAMNEPSGHPEYDRVGRVSAQVDPLGNRVSFYFDDANKPTKTVDQENNESTVQYDQFQRQSGTTNTLNKTTQYKYDELGRQDEVVDPLMNSTKQVFDLAGNSIRSIDAKGQESIHKFDSLGRQEKMTDRLLQCTRYEFDRAGRLASIQDADDRTTRYGYDAFGRQSTVQYPDHVEGTDAGHIDFGIRKTDYDALGRVRLRTDQKGNTVAFNYDSAGRLESRQYRERLYSPSGTVADQDTFTYLDTGQVETAECNRYGNKVIFDYDTVGRKTQERLSFGGYSFVVGTGYDPLSRVDEIIYPDGRKAKRKYNSRSLLEEVLFDGDVVDTRIYDAVGRLESSSCGNGVSTAFDYFDDGLIKSIATTNNGTQQIGTYSYTWDANRNKTSETITGTGAIDNFGFATGPNGYDSEDRLVGWSRDDGFNQSWELSGVGDWNSLTESSPGASTQITNYTNSAAHETVAIDNAAIEYDANGNRLTAYDGVSTYDWDFDNRLACVGDHSFEYDALGRRVAMSVDGQTTILVCHDQQLIAMYRRETNSGTTTSVFERGFVYGSYIDEPIVMVTEASRYWYSRNQQFSIVGLTNQGGQVVERYNYDAYGKTQILSSSGSSLTESAVGNPFAFTGRFLNAAIELCYFRARYYDPATGDFLNRDPLEYVDGMSQYRAYFVPNHTDPSGTVVPVIPIVIGASCLACWASMGSIMNAAHAICQNKKTFASYFACFLDQVDKIESSLGWYAWTVANAACLACGGGVSGAGKIFGKRMGKAWFKKKLKGETTEAVAAGNVRAKCKEVAKCQAIHKAYKAVGNCRSCKSMTAKSDVQESIACLTAVIGGRKLYLKKRCDYILAGSIARGSAIAEAGHQKQVQQLQNQMATCVAKLAALS